MRKLYCDVCGKEISKGIRPKKRLSPNALYMADATSTIEGDYEVCQECMEVVESINWSETIHRAIEEKRKKDKQ